MQATYVNFGQGFWLVPGLLIKNIVLKHAHQKICNNIKTFIMVRFNYGTILASLLVLFLYSYDIPIALSIFR